jgi:hypothetical protein
LQHRNDDEGKEHRAAENGGAVSLLGQVNAHFVGAKLS